MVSAIPTSLFHACLQALQSTVASDTTSHPASHTYATRTTSIEDGALAPLQAQPEASAADRFSAAAAAAAGSSTGSVGRVGSPTGSNQSTPRGAAASVEEVPKLSLAPEALGTAGGHVRSPAQSLGMGDVSPVHSVRSLGPNPDEVAELRRQLDDALRKVSDAQVRGCGVHASAC